MNSDERERLEQIRERRTKLSEQRTTLSWEVSPFECMCEEACEPFMLSAPKDIDFLLSLYDQLRTENERLNAIVSAYENEDEEALAEASEL